MSERALPAWAREEAFPRKPESKDFGFSDGRGQERAFETFAELRAYLETGKGRLAWVWTPEREHMIAPEELPELAATLRKRRLMFASEDQEEAQRSFPFTAIAGLYALYCWVQSSRPFGFQAFEFAVMAGLAFLYFTARPWWEARKGRKVAAQLSPETMAEEIPEARFDLWMESQKTPLTIVLMGLLFLVGIGQFLTPGLGIAEAGLDKSRYALGETWRAFTGAFLHGNVIHFAMNASALWYLGRRVEILARWPHFAGVFFLSILGASWATIAWMPLQTSVGVSGVVCGLLGFLLVFETLHRPLVPRPARRRLAGILVSLVVIGAVGFRFIDNAAHLGGLVTGAFYALAVFPKSSSPQRPVILKRDYAIGGVSILFIFAAAIAAIAAMLMR